MKGSIALLISGLAAQQVAATWNRQASGYNTPQYNNNECSDKQSKGFDWSDLKDGQKDFDYGDFKFGGGWTCANSFGKRDHVTKRSFNSKCVKNTVTKEKPAKITCDDKKKDGFSVKEIDVSVDHDADLEFHYKMGDGSTCKQTQACSKSGTTVKNTQCGGAKSVEIHFKGSKGKEQKKSCEIGFHKIDFDCTPGKKYTPAPPLPSSPPKTSSSASKSSSSTLSTATKPASSSSSSSSAASSSSYSTLSTATKPASSSSSAASSSYSTVSSSAPASSKPATSSSSAASSSHSTGSSSIPTPSAPASSKPATSSAPGSSSVYTPISSVPTPSASSSSSKPSSSAPGSSSSSVASSSSSSAASSSTGSSSAPASSKPATSAPGSSAGSSSVYTPVPTPSGKPSTTPAGSTAASSSGKPSSSAPASSKPESEKPSSSAPETSKPSPSAPVYPPLSCPEVLPKCLNTWIEINSKCKDNTDSKCYCKIPDFTKNVIDCVAARATPEDASKALQYFVGICAADVPKNPGIITDCPSDIPINVAPPAPATSTKPAATGPAPTAPASSAPVSSKPVGSAPVPSGSAPAPSAPAPSAPAPSAPAPSAPAPSAPAPSIPCTTITIGTTSYTVPQIIFTTTTPEPQAPGAPAPTPGYEPIAIVPVASYPAEVPAQTTAVAPYPVPSGISTAVKPTGTGAVGTGAVVPTAVVNFPGAASNVRFEIPAAMAAVLALFAL